MRLREYVFVTMLMSLATITTVASPPLEFEEAWTAIEDGAASYAKTNMSASVPVALSPLIQEDKVFGSAYYDTLSILSTANNCSDFFGGPEMAVEIFNKLVGRVRKSHFPSAIGMRMSGQTTSLVNTRTKAQYRLFDNVTLNAKGPFYRTRFSNSEPAMSRIGSFDPNTREARILIFLHELGHIVKRQDGQWLLPNDGNNEVLSRNNSQKIEDVCGDEIKSIRRGTARLMPRTDRTQEQLF